MLFFAPITVLMFAATTAPTPTPTTPIVNHVLAVRLDVNAGHIDAVDVMTWDNARSDVEFVVHAGLTVTVDGAVVTSLATAAGPHMQRWHVHLASPARGITLHIAGVIVQPPEQVATEQQRGFAQTPGTISSAGVYLSSGAGWFAQLVQGDARTGELWTGSVAVSGLPAGWSALSEGDLQGDTWVIATPVDDVHIVAGPFVKQARRIEGAGGGVDAMVWLRTADAGLSARYLEATEQYLRMYQQMLGPYPYTKFALVENFWETGYGMPSFTLLGGQVLRFPFILTTSYPHELLHNWWGNGVFVTPDAGNWSEGLTAYLADHLSAQQQGRGVEHRRALLERARDFVTAHNDFALDAFVARDSPASEAIGYGKSAMLFHMLRKKLGAAASPGGASGDARFIAVLRKFYLEHRFARASFADVAAAFEAEMPTLGTFVRAWTRTPGMPIVRWRELSVVTRAGGAQQLVVALAQTQSGAVFEMDVPVVVTTADARTLTFVVAMTDRNARATFDLPAHTTVARIDVDPWFDTFRAPLQGETPPALSRALGAARAVFVVPSLGAPADRDAWKRFAAALCSDGPSCAVVDDTSAAALPSDAAIWVLGYGNRLRGAAATVTAFGAHYEDRGFIPPGAQRAARVDHATTALVLALTNGINPDNAMVFVGAPDATSIDALAKKIPHYGKYGFLTFAATAEGLSNVLKGQWAQSTSPMTVWGSATHPPLAADPAPPLAVLPTPFDAARMLSVVSDLASARYQGRASRTASYDLSLTRVERELRAAGLSATRVCTAEAGCNLVASIAGTDASLAPVVLGAHLDHLGTQKRAVFLGADDNASGVSVILEVARVLARTGPFARRIDLVWFAGEEQGLLGSRAFVAAQSTPAFAMVNLDTVGRRGDKPLLVLDGDSAAQWVHIVRGVGFTTGVDVQLASQGGGASDQRSFIAAGIPAVQLFSGANIDYHKPTDSADKVQAHSLVDAASVAREMIVYLADRKEPLTVKGAAPVLDAPTSARRAALGTVPDMQFAGPGVRVDDVVAGSAAATAGVLQGDVLVRFGGARVADLAGYSALLKQRAPGDTVRVEVLRDGRELSFEVRLGAR